jgi:aryl-alcohol dehydrogenase-like predicted oxidoreductase
MAIMTRILGSTGAQVTVLGYGAMELRGRPRGPEIADADAGRLLNGVLDGGINLIDTSPDYGRSEELIGRYIGHRRAEFFLASKCGCPLESPAGAPPPYPHDYRPGNVRAVVEQSLRRLRTDHLDLVQVHMSPSRATLEENHTVDTLRGLQAAGQVRFIGMSGLLPNLPDHLAMGVFDVFQIPYSAVQRDHEALITQAARAGAGTFIRGGAARGAAAPDKNWRAGPLSQDPGVGQRNWETSGLAGLLEDAGMSNMEFILRFTLSHPGLSSTIVGTANPAHLAGNIAVAARGPLPADLYAQAKQRLPLPAASLRGRPRGRLKGTIAPCSSSSPPQTPHGSSRPSAPAKQATRSPHVPHSAFARSTSRGDSAKNSSGCRRQGRSRATRGAVAELVAPRPASPSEPPITAPGVRWSGAARPGP